jgi:hypothetical protein
MRLKRGQKELNCQQDSLAKIVNLSFRYFKEMDLNQPR